jgi:TonB family protein
MTLLVRGKGVIRRKISSFAASACLHGSVITWMMIGPPLPGGEPKKSLYEQEIQPNEKKIVWYTVREKLPDVSPTEVRSDSEPPRAKLKAKQTIVSGPKDDDGATQRIFMPAPEIETPKPLPLPNAIAVARPNLAKPFVAPPDVIQEPKPAPALPDAPKVAGPEVKPLPMEAASVKPKPLPFQPPPEAAPKARPSLALPDAPKVAALAAAKPLGIEGAGAKPAPLAFTPPPTARIERQAPILLPEAPAATGSLVEANALPFEPGGARPERRKYVPPAAAGAVPRNGAPAALPNAPEVAAVPANVAAGASGPKGVPRTFVAPPSKPAASGTGPAVNTDAPAAGDGALGGNAETTLAIVGLNPVNSTAMPSPPGSRNAGFSAGPVQRPTGGMGSAGGAALLGVPNLTVRGGENDAQSTLAKVNILGPTAKENLIAAARSAPAASLPPSPPPKAPAEPTAARVSEAPDPRLSGRLVYMVAIQMPNVTSFSGSWLVWFAEHTPVPGEPAPNMKAPNPLHKVDPKYIAAAQAEHVEGKVRLYGVIRKDGHVDSIALLHHLDVRLDRSAADALAQWVFEPALRNGRPVEVDAVFEIPFHLAPRAAK